jgi:copper(I)-binding protein
MTLEKRRRFVGQCVLSGALLGAPLPGGAVAVTAVSDPWVRVAPNARSAEVFMEIRSSEAATLVGVRSDVTTGAIIQSPGTKRGTAASIPLPPGATVKLVPGGYRFVLPTLSRALTLGDRVGLELIVEAPDGSRLEIPVSAEVRRRSAYDDHRQPHAHAH